MSGVRAEDNDRRAEEMVEDPDRYFSRARIRAQQETRAPARKPAVLAPGIVAMSLRGDKQDVERLVAAMREMGVVVWRIPDRGLQGGREAGYAYFSAEVPPE